MEVTRIFDPCQVTVQTLFEGSGYRFIWVRSRPLVDEGLSEALPADHESIFLGFSHRHLGHRSN